MKNHSTLGLLEAAIILALASKPLETDARADFRAKVSSTICTGPQRAGRFLSPHAASAMRWAQVGRDCRYRTRRTKG
mgnify:CR=1 FL=1